MTRTFVPRAIDVLDAAAPFVLALAIGAAILFAAGFEPLGVYRLMVEEAFGGERRIAATLTAATPLLLTGLAAALAFRAGVFNVGAEGCFYLGGLVAAGDHQVRPFPREGAGDAQTHALPRARDQRHLARQASHPILP